MSQILQPTLSRPIGTIWAPVLSKNVVPGPREDVCDSINRAARFFLRVQTIRVPVQTQMRPRHPSFVNSLHAIRYREKLPLAESGRIGRIKHQNRLSRFKKFFQKTSGNTSQLSNKSMF